MKKFILSACVLALTALAASAQAPIGPGSVKMGRVTVEAPSSPEYSINGGPQKRAKNEKWLEFEVAYETHPEEIEIGRAHV